jgi:hypothetical protein
MYEDQSSDLGFSNEQVENWSPANYALPTFYWTERRVVSAG